MRAVRMVSEIASSPSKMASPRRPNDVAHATPNDGFTLIELLIAIAVLMFGLFGVLAVFASTARKEARIEDEYTASILAKSLANAIEIAFATPIDPEFDVANKTGPQVRIDHDGLFHRTPDEPEGYAIVRLPGMPEKPNEPPLPPEEIDPVVYPDKGIYRMGRFVALAQQEAEEGATEEDPLDILAEPNISHLRQYSFTLTFRNWRTKYRSKVPKDAPGVYNPMGNENAFALPDFNPDLNEFDFIERGGNRGYEVTIRIYRSTKAPSGTEMENVTVEDLVERDLEDPSLIAKERFIFLVNSSFGQKGQAP